MNRVSVGTWVRLTGFEPDEEEVYRIVPEDQANALENEIPVHSPLARALEGAGVGDKVKFHPPAGEVELTVLEVGKL
jgi:transcription elongation GreA/GreB family factor